MKPYLFCLAILSALAPAAPSAELSPPAVVPVSDADIARFEGVWFGHQNPTPFGPISFAIDFRREGDGSLHSHSAMSQSTWVDLHFRKDETGQWVLDESASLADMGVQKYRLHPVRAEADTLVWAFLDSPWFLTVRTAVNDDELYMLVLLRGEQHVLFSLPRVTGDLAVAVRNQLEAGRQRPGDNDVAVLKTAGRGGSDTAPDPAGKEAGEADAAASADDPDAIRTARARVKSAPEDPQAHLELAMALSEVIESAPPHKVPGYAFEMLFSFQEAARLDPESVDAHFGLAQYYLNAPPIAGGSLETAGKQAAVLAELGSPLSEVVLAQIEVKQGNTEQALERLRGVVDLNPNLEIARQLVASLDDSDK